jgi:hypothetical protein
VGGTADLMEVQEVSMAHPNPNYDKDSAGKRCRFVTKPCQTMNQQGS